MRNSSKAFLSAAPFVNNSSIADDLARKGVDMLLSVEDCGVLIQAYVSSGVAARMLAPLGRKAVGQFRSMTGNMVEIDAVMTHAMAAMVLAARSEALGIGTSR